MLKRTKLRHLDLSGNCIAGNEFSGTNPTTYWDVGGMMKNSDIPVTKDDNQKVDGNFNRTIELGKKFGEQILNQASEEIEKSKFYSFIEGTWQTNIDSLINKAIGIRGKQNAGGKIEKAIEKGLNLRPTSSKNVRNEFNRMWRGVDSGMDEHLPTSTVRNLLQGIGEAFRESRPNDRVGKRAQDITVATFKLVSQFRLPTGETGYSFKCRNGVEFLQHPGSGKSFYGDLLDQAKHDMWNNGRVEDAVKSLNTGLYKGAEAIINMALEAVRNTLACGVAPAMAGNIYTLEGISDEEKERQTQNRENIKEIYNMVKTALSSGGQLRLSWGDWFSSFLSPPPVPRSSHWVRDRSRSMSPRRVS